LFTENPEVSQLHFGGGTPTFLSDEQLRDLMGTIRQHFRLVADGEYSIEIDPRKVNYETIKLLGEVGFNRISLGVQDFDPEVQKVVNRIHSEEETLLVMNAARRYEFKSISIDLIYGLPKQNIIGFNRTLEHIIQANPDRVAIYQIVLFT
jgi:oxygen-independent coproporphyrinogen-3 oxidase